MKLCLLGPLWGDICGAPYEFHPERDPEAIDLAHPNRDFTDDTVLTLAVAKAILERRPYRDTLFELARAYPNVGYGGRFLRQWLQKGDPSPYGSFGNGAAMRVAPVGWAFNTVEDVLREAEASAACSHDHPDGIASAQAVALAVFLARKGQDKAEIREALEERFGYALSAPLASFWGRRASTTVCAKPSPLAATPTHRPASPAPWPRPTTAPTRPWPHRWPPSSRRPCAISSRPLRPNTACDPCAATSSLRGQRVIMAA